MEDMVGRLCLFVLIGISLINYGNSSVTCPDRCECRSLGSLGSVMVDCDRADLTEIPEDIQCDVKQLELDFNYISTIRKSSFRECHTNLRQISVQINVLRHIE